MNELLGAIDFQFFHAIRDFPTCTRFREGHVNVLKAYNITNITTNNDNWMANPGAYGIVALERESQNVVGGIRIHLSSPQHSLPVEQAIGKMDPRIHSLVEHMREEGPVAELCALWNDRMVAGWGISLLLTRAGIAISGLIGVKTLMGICADYTLPMFQRVGFVVNNQLGTEGTFPYPNQDYLARVLGILNAETLDTALEEDRIRMMDIRTNPNQRFLEETSKGIVDANYALWTS
jgi:hypothetical protein